jgi:hypothetical protein
MVPKCELHGGKSSFPSVSRSKLAQVGDVFILNRVVLSCRCQIMCSSVCAGQLLGLPTTRQLQPAFGCPSPWSMCPHYRTWHFFLGWERGTTGCVAARSILLYPRRQQQRHSLFPLLEHSTTCPVAPVHDSHHYPRRPVGICFEWHCVHARYESQHLKHCFRHLAIRRMHTNCLGHMAIRPINATCRHA